jgi:hypothetical protein
MEADATDAGMWKRTAYVSAVTPDRRPGEWLGRTVMKRPPASAQEQIDR